MSDPSGNADFRSGSNNNDKNNINNSSQQVKDGGRRSNPAPTSNRRSSLGMTEVAFGDLFGRRSSGFSDLDVLGRRGSLDSTSAVLDAAIMDLTRRRLSMAMGAGDGFGGNSGDPFGGGGNFGAGGFGGGGGMDLMGGGGGVFGGMGGMANLATLGQMHMNAAGNNDRRRNHNNKDSSGGNNNNNNDNSMNNQQKQIQQQQRELERRQKELELQRQQIMAAMEERRVVMQQMQQKLGQMPAGAPAMQRNSLLGSFGGGFGMGNLGGNSNLLMGLGGGMGAAARAGSFVGAAAGVPASTANPQWQICKICNARAFASREEAAQHEAICMAMERGRRASLGMGNPGRRGSLDMLMGLAGQQGNGHRDSLGMGLMGDRRFSLMGDSMNNNNNFMNTNQHISADHQLSTPTTTFSKGPFAMMDEPLPLALGPDKDWLTPLHCFVRQHFVHIFTASEQDVATPSKGKRKPIQVGQVGIRCPHCHQDIESSVKARERGSVYYPTSIASIYNATMNLLQRHLHHCSSVPPDIMRRYETLKADDARSGTSKKYWIESALSLGLVDTENGIRFSGKTGPPLPSRPPGNDFFTNAMTSTSNEDPMHNINMDNSSKSHGEEEDSKMPHDSHGADQDEPAQQQGEAGQGGLLVRPEDEQYATAFSYHLIRQMQPCVFTEADRLGKRKGLPPGFPGLACRHCWGGYGSGRFFPSSIKTLSDTSKTLNVLHNHMMRCRKCPPTINHELAKYRKIHDEQRAKMKFGSQKAFFARIWDRLHFKDPNVTSKRKFKAKETPIPANLQAALQQQQPSFNAAMAMQQFGDMINKRQKT